MTDDRDELVEAATAACHLIQEELGERDEDGNIWFADEQAQEVWSRLFRALIDEVVPIADPPIDETSDKDNIKAAMDIIDEDFGTSISDDTYWILVSEMVGLQIHKIIAIIKQDPDMFGLERADGN